MPGTTEPIHLFEGVAVGNDGVFWYVAVNTTNTVVTVSSENIEVILDDDSIDVYTDAN